MGAVWGLVVAAAKAALASLILILVILWRRRRITENEEHSRGVPLLLLCAAIFALCGISLAYLTERGESLCIARRVLGGLLFAICITYVVFQGVQLHRLARGAHSPHAGALVGLVVPLAVLDPEWILLTDAVSNGQPACAYQSLALVLASIYVLVLFLMPLVGMAYSLWNEQQPQPWRYRARWLLVTCLASVVLRSAWMPVHLYASAALGLSSIWEDRAQAVMWVVQAWLLLLLQAVPEAYAFLRSPPHLREDSAEEGSSQV